MSYGKQWVARDCSGVQRSGAEALLTDKGCRALRFHTQEKKKDLQYFARGRVWHLGYIHSFIHSIKILGTCRVPGSMPGAGDTGEQVGVVSVLRGPAFSRKMPNVVKSAAFTACPSLAGPLSRGMGSSQYL